MDFVPKLRPLRLQGQEVKQQSIVVQVLNLGLAHVLRDSRNNVGFRQTTKAPKNVLPQGKVHFHVTSVNKIHLLSINVHKNWAVT
jgi:hypothetical protein